VSWAIWITGLPGSGKSAIARATAGELRRLGRPVTRLELDEIRRSITPSPRYTDAERDVVYRALTYLATVLTEAEVPVLIDATGHRRVWRDLARAVIPHFAEVQLICPLEVCQERERTRPLGHAPRNIYRQAGSPGATVPGVDVLYEAAASPEVVIDTGGETVEEGAARVVQVAQELAARAGGGAVPTAAELAEPGWAIWITGRPGSGKSTLATRTTDALAERGVHARVLNHASVRRFLLGDRAIGEGEQDFIYRVLAYAAKLLTEAGVSVIVDATASRRLWREAARSLIPGFAEVQLLCPAEICLERERAVHWGLASGLDVSRRVTPRKAPDIVLDYEESLRPDLALRTDVHDVWTAVEQVLILVQRLRSALPDRLETRERGRP
jgi:adenylylsulfate kinase